MKILKDFSSMDRQQEIERFRNLCFEDFSRMASDNSLQPHEKVGFPAVFRAGFDAEIFRDIKSKVDWNNANTLVDIGCGCGELVKLITNDTEKNDQQLILVDSIEVLNQLPDQKNQYKIAGRFPDNDADIKKIGLADVVICYSVFHYVFMECNPFDFIERALGLLKPGGKFLLGDIPNVTKRNRFLLTPAGEAFHKDLMNTNDKPMVPAFAMDSGKMDDGFILSLLTRYRNFGVETYLLPQPHRLPLSNSREDILFIKH